MSRTCFAVLALAGMLATGGCNDQGLSQIPEPEYPAIEVDKESIEFGSLEIGMDPQQAEVTITSVGDADLTVSDLYIDGPEHFELFVQDTPVVMEPGALIKARVQFTALNGADVNGSFWIGSDDPDRRNVEVLLHGAGLGPAISIDPSVFDFGNIGVWCEEETEVLIKSVGTSPLTIDSWEFTAVPSLTAMTFSTSELYQGLELDPGESAAVIVTLAPVDLEQYEGLLTVSSNDPAYPQAQGVQTGAGSGGEWITDYFVQEGTNWTDILWVVDNSESMTEEQNQLGDDFTYFHSIVNTAGVDYHIATVTTDDADFQGNTKVIDPSTPNGAQVFADNCNVGVNGSWDEMGLKFGWDALQMAVNNTPPNQGFLRTDAGLRVVFVSDEMDVSPGNWSDYVTDYQSLKANPDHVILSAICGTDGSQADTCWGQGGQAMGGHGYVDAVNATGGILGCICDSSWSTTLTNLAWNSMSLANTLELSETPIPSTITVKANGVQLNQGWSYEAAINAVVLEPSYIPDNGDEIEVHYQVPEGCTG